MLPWPTNTFIPMGKSIIWVKIDPWPRFGHIFVHSTFSKLPKISWKWRISIESQAGSISYQKALAKGQHEMKNQSFWPTNKEFWFFHQILFLAFNSKDITMLWVLNLFSRSSPTKLWKRNCKIFYMRFMLQSGENDKKDNFLS